MKKTLFRKPALRVCILLVLLLVVGVTVLPAAAQPGVVWTGQYFNTADLTAPVVATRQDNAIAFNWGVGAPIPGMSADNFSVQWVANANFNAGTYRFYIFADDSVRLMVDGIIQIDTFDLPQPGQLQTIDIPLTAGVHTVIVAYAEISGEAYAYFTWADLASNPTGPNFPLTASSVLDGTSWIAQYFNNSTLSGTPAAILTETTLNHNWGTNAPVASVGADQFSVRWSANISLSGSYRLDAQADDGLRFYIDGAPLLNEWHDAQGTSYSVPINVAPGTHSVIVEYYENSGAAFLNISLTSTADGAASSQPGGLWTADYFGNRDLTGAPVLERTVYTPANNWGANSPDPLLPADGFSIRWTSHPDLSEGNYRFSIQADDGVRLIVDDQTYLDEWHTARAETYNADVPLAAGAHTIVVEYYDETSLAFLNYSMSRTGEYAGVPRDTGATGTVDTFRLNVRDTPTVNGNVLVRINQGETYPIVGRTSDSSWWQLQIDANTMGWASAEFIRSANTANVPITSQVARPNVTPTAYTLVVTDITNIRSGPSTRTAILGEIPQGRTAQIVGRNSAGTWYYVLYNGVVGWVSSTLVELQQGVTLDQIPIQQ